ADRRSAHLEHPQRPVGVTASRAPLRIGGLPLPRPRHPARGLLPKAFLRKLGASAWPLVFGGGRWDRTADPVQCGPEALPVRTLGGPANWDSNTVLVYPAKFY